jgi:hypothetical protein
MLPSYGRVAPHFLTDVAISMCVHTSCIMLPTLPRRRGHPPPCCLTTATIHYQAPLRTCLSRPRRVLCHLPPRRCHQVKVIAGRGNVSHDW